MRPKTKRRLLILLVAILMVVGGAALLVRLSVAREDRKARDARAAGMAAFEQGEYEAALVQLSVFNSRFKDDPDAIYAQAVARSMVVEPQRKHTKTAIDWLKHYQSLRPNDLKAKHKLLDLYVQLNRTRETLDTADQILKIDPKDLVALKTKANTYLANRQFREALAASEKVNEVAPLDLDGQQVTYQILAKLKRPGAEVVDRAKADLGRFPEDPRMELLLAIAYGYAGDDASARRMLTIAAGRKAPSADFVRFAAQLLDADRSFAVSRKMLERAVEDLKTPDVLQLLVQRLWQDGDIAEMGRRLAEVDANDPRAHTNLLAMKAISLSDQGDRAAARRVIDALAKRAGDDEAYAWSTAIQAYYGGRADPKEAITALKSAAARDRDNAVIHLWMGDACEQLGEVEMAADAYKTAAQLSPAWAMPYVRQAKLLAAAGRAEEAYQAAQLASDRAPRALEARIAVVMALSAKLVDDPRALSGSSLLRLVDDIQTDFPNEPQTLPMYVTLLARAGQTDRANTAIANAIKPDAKVPVDTLLKLVDVSAQLKLGQEDALLAAASRGEPTAALALAKARRQHTQGQTEEAVAGLRKAIQDATSDPADWSLALATFLDETRPTPDLPTWKALVEKYPADLRVQSAFLRSPARNLDRTVWAATVDRLKQLTHEEGTRWRLERARFLLSGDASDRDRADAITLVNELLRINPDLPEPRLMLATHALKSGNRTAAVDQLKKVIDLQPGNVQAVLTLARLLHEQGQSLESQSYLSRLANSTELTDADIRVIAQMFADQGEATKAINLLRQLRTPDLTSDVLLGQLYRREGRTRDAAQIFARIATASPITPEAIAATADYFFENKEPQRGKEVLNRLDELKDLPAGVANIVRGQVAERHDHWEVAQWFFLEAVNTANNGASNRELAGFYLRRGDIGKARTVAMAGLAVAKDDAGLSAMVKAIEGLDNVPADHRSTLAVLISRNPADATVNALLKAMAEPADRRLAAIRAVAERNAGSWPVLEQLALAYQAAGQSDRARETAQRGLSAAPRDVDPARLLYGFCVKAEDWTAARAAAEQWRMRAGQEPRPADVAAATAAVELGRNDEAIDLLKPYLDAARADLKNWADVLWPYARAMLRNGKNEEVASLMADAIRTSDAVRQVWLALSADVRPSALAATAWINRAAEHVGPGTADQAALGWAWFSVGQKYDDSAAYARAAETFTKLIDKGENTLGNWIIVADALRGTNDLAGAENAYRRAIALGDSGHSCNALAFLLAMQDKQLDEAQALSSRAIATSPRQAEFFDTRGQIHLKQNKPQAASDDFDRALSLKEDLTEALIGKGAALVRLGQVEQARSIVQQVDAVLATRPLISRYARAQLGEVRQAIGK